MPDGWRLYRRLLAAQLDHSVSIVSVGFITCLAQLLASGADEYSSLSGVELVRRKVKCNYLQGGVFGKALEPDFNFAQGITFAKTFFQNWPQDVDMVFSPMEAGNCRYQLPGTEESLFACILLCILNLRPVLHVDELAPRLLTIYDLRFY